MSKSVRNNKSFIADKPLADQSWANDSLAVAEQTEQELAVLLCRRRRFEVMLGLVTMLVLCGMVACQVWLWLDRGQTVAAWSGVVYDVEPAAATMNGLYGSVTIELLDYSELTQAYVLINGQRAGTFDDNELTLRVFEGDVLELDVTAYRVPVRFRLGRLSAGIREDLLLSEVELCGERKSLGHIAF